MEFEFLDLLEAKIQQAATLIKSLREENRALHEKVTQLELEAQRKEELIEKLRGELATRPKQGPSFEKEQEIRRRIEVILQKLELLDLQKVDE